MSGFLKRKQGSVEVGPPAVEGESRARRCYLSPDKLIESVPEGYEHLADILKSSAEKYPNSPSLGYRDLVKMHKEEKEITKTVGGKEVKETKQWQYYELTDYKFWTYKEFYDYVNNAGSALVELGHSKQTIFNIYSATSPRWQVLAQGCASQGITFATAYDSLGEEGLEHSLNQPEVYGVFTNANLLGTLAKVIAKTPTVKVVVYDGKNEDVPSGAIDTIKNAHDGIKVLAYDDFIQLGRDNPKERNPSGKEDLACIMYTSGSTGAPKGVMISNGNIVAALGAVYKLLGSVVKQGETYIAYLPLAHILEFVVELCIIYVGLPMGYGTVKTLTDSSVRNCVGDIRAFRPTIMVGVPAVWELIRKGIGAKVKAGGSLKSNIFNGAVTIKKFSKNVPGLPLGSVMDAVVFNAVKQATGGRLRYALSGGAPISKDTQEFLSIALVETLQGYGMTESTAMCAILPPDFMQYGVVGVPVPAVEIKLVDVPDAGYFAQKNPPRGEILIRGPAVTKGYYKLDDITKETITEDGWLRTGDIGEWKADGTLSIIDRKKNLVKLAGGEYIALEKLESIYKSCPLVANICLVADSNANKPMALVFPTEAHLKSFVKDHGIADKDEDLKALCENKKVRDAVVKEMNNIGKKAGLKPLESLQTIILTPEEWTPQNGMLTAAQKLQRKVIHEKYASEIKKIYP